MAADVHVHTPGNSIGPFAGIYAAWQCTCVYSKSDVPVWILVISGVGVALGLATYTQAARCSYKIMRVLGAKMVRLTNSRGYCVELSAAAAITVGSRYGLPLSTTHCLVGAVTGVGLVEAVFGRKPEGATTTGRKAFNWLLLLKFFCGCVATLVIAALTSAAFNMSEMPASTGNALLAALRQPMLSEKLSADSLVRNMPRI